VHSREAELFMKILRPILKEKELTQKESCKERVKLLDEWDLNYDVESKGALLFENVWKDIMKQVFGERLFGEVGWVEFVKETGLLPEYHYYFDRLVLDENKFDEFVENEEKREVLLRRAVKNGLCVERNENERLTLKKWGEHNSVVMRNIWFNEQLPKWLGFDIDVPGGMKGNRNTVCQGNTFKSHGRRTSFAPSLRFLSDMGESVIQTCCPGGVSGRRWSGLYYNMDYWGGADQCYKPLSVSNSDAQ